MPTYEYECNACGHTFEKFQSMSDGALRKCPECGKLKLQHLVGSGAGIIFKGSGFYETDYKRKPSPDGGAKESKADTSSNSETSSKSSESKSTENSKKSSENSKKD